MENQRFLSIALIYHNEEDHLPDYLENILTLQKSMGSTPILLIDNASTDSSYAKVEAWIKKHPTISVQHCKRKWNHMGCARAQAINLCPTPWLAFIDADCRPHLGWGQAALVAVENATDDIAAIGGRSHFVGYGPLQRVARLLSWCLPWAYSKNQVQRVTHLPTNNLLMRVHAVQSVGNFSRDFQKVGEDLELSCRLNKKFKIIMDPCLEVDHLVKSSLGHWLKKLFNYGLAQPRAFLNHPTQIDKKKLLPLIFLIGLLIVLWYLPVIGFSTLGLLLVVPVVRPLLLSVIAYALGEWVGLVTFPIFVISRKNRRVAAFATARLGKVDSSRKW
ncbi:MAG: glycosyltransferase [Bdellovibrionales bacterium]|nr:glycosyltransferase [Bdellovibrionales bacterium]